MPKSFPNGEEGVARANASSSRATIVNPSRIVIALELGRASTRDDARTTRERGELRNDRWCAVGVGGNARASDGNECDGSRDCVVVFSRSLEWILG
jgi:hypothetical protein